MSMYAIHALFNSLPTGCGNDGQFKDFCHRLDMSDLQQKFIINLMRVKNRHELVVLIKAIKTKKAIKSGISC